MDKIIDKFVGKYHFLSNFFIAPVFYNGRMYLNNEAAFQSVKCPSRSFEFCSLNPSDAKRLGRMVKLRPDWEDIKDTIMYEVCKAKFSQNRDLLYKLLETDGYELIEGNHWGDTVWGVCNGIGENRLGRILMRVRDELKIEELYK